MNHAVKQAASGALTRSELRGEADRARAILLTPSDWTSRDAAEAFGVTAASVRHWRQWFAEDGVEALRPTLAPASSAARGAQALVRAVLREPGQGRAHWTPRSTPR